MTRQFGEGGYEHKNKNNKKHSRASERPLLQLWTKNCRPNETKMSPNQRQVAFNSGDGESKQCWPSAPMGGWAAKPPAACASVHPMELARQPGNRPAISRYQPAGPKMERAGTPSKWFPSYSALLFFVLVNTVELEIGWKYFHSPTLYLIESWLEKTQVGLFCSLLVQHKLELCWGGHNVSQHILPEANLSEN